MGIIDLTACPVKTGTIYPEPYASQMAGRSSLRLGDAAGLTQFGANLFTLEPGARSSLRHWHEAEDEFDDSELVVKLREMRESLVKHYELGPSLADQLAEAIAKEEYELAARLRDRINGRQAN